MRTFMTKRPKLNCVDTRGLQQNKQIPGQSLLERRIGKLMKQKKPKINSGGGGGGWMEKKKKKKKNRKTKYLSPVHQLQPEELRWVRQSCGWESPFSWPTAALDWRNGWQIGGMHDRLEEWMAGWRNGWQIEGMHGGYECSNRGKAHFNEHPYTPGC